jgi:hypothetical protein
MTTSTLPPWGELMDTAINPLFAVSLYLGELEESYPDEPRIQRARFHLSRVDQAIRTSAKRWETESKSVQTKQGVSHVNSRSPFAD